MANLLTTGGKGRPSGYGRKDGSQKGWKRGGLGRNRTSTCRHPNLLQKRKARGDTSK